MALPRTASLVLIAAASVIGLLMVMRPDFVTTSLARMRCEGPTYSFVRLIDAGDRVRFAMVNVRDHDMARLIDFGGAEGDAGPSWGTRLASATAAVLMALLEPADAAIPDWLHGDHPNLRRVVNAGCVTELAALGGPIGLIRRLAPGTPHRVATSSVAQRQTEGDLVPASFDPAAAEAEAVALGLDNAATVAVAGVVLDIAAVGAACLLIGRRRRQASAAAA